MTTASEQPEPVRLVAALAGVDAAVCEVTEVEQHVLTVSRLRSWLDAVETRLVGRAAELGRDGRGSGPTATLVGEGLLTSRGARRIRDRAETVESAPELEAALERGLIGADHVDAVTRAARRLDEGPRAALFDRSEELAERASSMPADAFDTWVGRLSRHLGNDEAVEKLDRQKKRTRLRWWNNDSTGMLSINGELDPEAGARFVAGINEEVDRLAAEGASRSELTSARALVELVTRGRSRGPASVVNELVLIVDADTYVGGLHQDSVCETGDGSPLPPESTRRLCCSTDLTTIVRSAKGAVLEAGRTRRTANRSQRRALRSMYPTCAFAGCDRPFIWCQIHHIVPWDRGGATDLANLLPLCSEHHHATHEGRWTLELGADRALEITRPDGAHYATVPLPNAPPSRRMRERRSHRGPQLVERNPDDDLISVAAPP